MTDPIYLPRSRSHRHRQMANLPHPADAHRLRITGNSLTSGDLLVAELGALDVAGSQLAQNALLELLTDCLAHGYRCATADLRRLLDHGKNNHG